MKTFLKRLGRTLLDLVTSKKAIAAGVGAILGAYVLGQGVADHGKEGVKAAHRADAYRLGKDGNAVVAK